LYVNGVQRERERERERKRMYGCERKIENRQWKRIRTVKNQWRKDGNKGGDSKSILSLRRGVFFFSFYVFFSSQS